MFVFLGVCVVIGVCELVFFMCLMEVDELMDYEIWFDCYLLC